MVGREPEAVMSILRSCPEESLGWAYAACKSGEALPSTVLRQKVYVVLSTRPVCLPSWKLEWGTCQPGGCDKERCL